MKRALKATLAVLKNLKSAPNVQLHELQNVVKNVPIVPGTLAILLASYWHDKRCFSQVPPTLAILAVLGPELEGRSEA